MTERPRVLPASDAAVEEAVAVLRRGGLVAIPTETVYGLGADASEPDAVRKIFAAKGRPSDHPLIVHLPGAHALGRWAQDPPQVAHELARAFWPGPLTLVLPRTGSVSDIVTGGRQTVGLRVPDQPLTLQLLERFGGGIAAPSANRFGRVSPTRAEHVVADLGDAVELVLDGGPCRVGVESTIVEMFDDSLEVLRIGTITVEELEEVAGRPVHALASGPARAPGMLESHYAPTARVVVAGEDPAGDVRHWQGAGHRVALLAETPPEDLPHGVIGLAPVGDADGYARQLYERLREADRLGAEVIVAVPPGPEGAGRAVRDRLSKAANTGD